MHAESAGDATPAAPAHNQLAAVGTLTPPSAPLSPPPPQDFARNDFELRQFVINGKIAHRIYTNFERTDCDGYFRDFVMVDRAEAVTKWMKGDDEAMAMAEHRAEKLCRAWLTWMRCQSVEELPAVRMERRIPAASSASAPLHTAGFHTARISRLQVRMDILVKRTGKGAAEVFTLELTELGFSMLTWPAGPPVVFGALLESCFADTGATPEEAARIATDHGAEATAGASLPFPGSGASTLSAMYAQSKKQRQENGQVADESSC